MVKLKEPAIGEMCRTIAVDGFSDYANPKRLRIALYGVRMGMPERDGEHQILQLCREVELMFNRNLFMKFAERVAELKKWMEQHPIDDMDMDKEQLKRYVNENFTSDEIVGIWLGHELRLPDTMPIGLLPLISEVGEEDV